MIIIADPVPGLRQLVVERVAQPTHPYEVETLEEADALTFASSEGGRVVILGPSIDRAAALSFAEKAERGHGNVATLIVAEQLESQLLRDALRAGVDDVLTIESTEDEWRESLARASARVLTGHHQPDTHDRAPLEVGRLVTVFSTKGGSGKSLVASNLAVLAARALDRSVALIDLNLQSGDLAIMLQLMPALSIFDAAQVSSRLDADALVGHLTPHRSNVSLLAAPMEPSLAEQVNASAVGHILDLAKQRYPLTIVDGPALFTDQLLAALDRSDQVILVASLDVPSIKNLRLAMNTLSQLGHGRDHLKIVLNRADSKVGLRPSEVEKSLGAAVDVQIPSSRDVPLSINQGTPLAITRPKSPVVTAIGQLVTELVPSANNDTRGGLFRRR